MSATPAASSLAPPTLADLRGTLRRRRPLVLLGMLVGLAAGLLMLQLMPEPVPTATVGIEIRPTGIDLNSPQGRSVSALDIERAIVRVTSEQVLSAATETHGAPMAPDVLREVTTVRQPGGAPLLRVTVEHSSPDTAVAAAQAIADAYLAESLADAEEELLLRDSRFREELDVTYAEVGALGKAIGELEEAADAEDGVGDPARVGALQGQLDAALRKATVLEQSRAVLASVNVLPGSIAEPAGVNDATRSLGAAVALPASLALGLLLGLAAALVVDRTDRRVWTAEDLTRATGITEVVRIEPSDLSGDGLRTGAGHRRLRTLVAPVGTETTILVTGAHEAMGSGIAAGLATSVAAAGRPVALIETADNDAFGLPSGDLEGWLEGRVGLGKASRSPEGVAGLRVLRGRPASELVGSQTLQQLLQTPQGVVILHIPGGSDSGDAIGLASEVDHIVVVVTAREDSGELAARTARWLGRDARRTPVLVLAG